MAQQRRLSLLTFDCDDTLYSTTDFARLARENSVRAMLANGLAVDFATAMAEMLEVIREFGTNDEHHLDRLLQRLPPDTHREVNPAILVAAGVAAYHNTVFNQLVPYEDVLESLRQLKERGFRLGIITQGITVKQAGKLVRLRVLPYLDRRAVFFSEQIGFTKSNPKCYQRVSAALGLPPAECMHVGDRPDHDVDPANRAGWLTVLNQRSHRPGEQKASTKPTYCISTFRELVALVEQDFAPAGSAAARG